MRPHACVAALALAVHGYLPPLPSHIVRTRRLATVQDEPQQTRKEFTVPEGSVDAGDGGPGRDRVESRRQRVVAGSLFVGTMALRGSCMIMAWSCRWAGPERPPDGERAVSSRELY